MPAEYTYQLSDADCDIIKKHSELLFKVETNGIDNIATRAAYRELSEISQSIQREFELMGIL